MSTSRLLLSLLASAALLLPLDAVAQGPPFGRGPGAGGRGPGGGGPGFGRGFRGGHGGDERFEEDHDTIHFLLDNHDKIRRTVKKLPNGVETVTESDDDKITAELQDHVHWMAERVEKRQPIRMRDPLFAELFRHTEKIKIKHEPTQRGVRVIETSDDPYVAKLIQAHADVVSQFVARGYDEATKNHPVPEGGSAPVEPKPEVPLTHPRIEKFGGVIRLPDAGQQPRAKTRIVVDLTAGGEPDQLNPAIEKLARFVNIYQGAGAEPASVSIAVVIHGDATLALLNADAYAKRHHTEGNPNLECLRAVHEAGVELHVCGQSLIRKGAKPEELVIFADLAVSGLTALANLQADGHAYVPLK